MFEHRFNDTWTVRQNFRYTKTDQYQSYLYLLGLESDLRTLDRYSYTDDETATGYTLDNQIQAKIQSAPSSFDNITESLEEAIYDQRTLVQQTMDQLASLKDLLDNDLSDFITNNIKD